MKLSRMESAMPSQNSLRSSFASRFVSAGLLRAVVALSIALSPSLARAGESQGLVQASVMARSLYVDGPVGAELVRAMQSLDWRGIDTLVITSHGGSVGYGLALASFVTKTGLTVMVPDYCESACTLILAGAKARLGSRSARFLIHGASNAAAEAGSGRTTVADGGVLVSNTLMRGHYMAHGVNAAFVDWAVETPRLGHEKTLSADEALRIGLLTAAY